MDRIELAKTIEARLEADPDIAATLVRAPRGTIEPQRHVSTRGVSALEALKKLSAAHEGKVVLHETLGEGGMGVVHLATQASLGRHVAVKTLKAGTNDLEAALRILREAWVTGALEHPNVVPVYDVGVDAAGSPIIVMKRIEGHAWSELMGAPEEIARRFSASDSLEWNIGILTSVCNAVHFAHSRGILHRDLKPENVMVGGFGEVYLLDWGIAVSLEDDPSGRLPSASNAKEIAGTPCYMAPEMLLGDPSLLSVRTDVYLLGAILYEIFAGAPPHMGPTVHAMVSSVLLSEPSFPPAFPAEARALCAKAMRREPGDRYQSAEALRQAIEAYMRHRGSRRLARDAKRSLTHLLHVLEHEPQGEERTLAVFNLLGECRFGYRSALAAWPDNEGARRGLDRALLAVVEHELSEGDPHAAATLLREVATPPPQVTTRVEAAIKARSEQDERLRRLELDTDPKVGSRTRAFVGSLLGVLWTIVPLVSWYFATRGGPPSHGHMIVGSVCFLVIGGLFLIWARESLTKTALNRRVSSTVGVALVAQIVLGVGGSLSGMPPEAALPLLLFTWALTHGLLAVWAEPRFAIPAVVAAASSLVAWTRPSWGFPLMSLVNLVLTAMLMLSWFSRQDFLRLAERRQELHRRARRWMVDAAHNVPPVGSDDDEPS